MLRRSIVEQRLMLASMGTSANTGKKTLTMFGKFSVQLDETCRLHAADAAAGI